MLLNITTASQTLAEIIPAQEVIDAKLPKGLNYKYRVTLRNELAETVYYDITDVPTVLAGMPLKQNETITLEVYALQHISFIAGLATSIRCVLT